MFEATRKKKSRRPANPRKKSEAERKIETRQRERDFCPPPVADLKRAAS